MQVARTANEIADQEGEAAAQEAENAPSQWPGMTYEQGVSAALRWVLGDTDDKPMDD